MYTDAYPADAKMASDRNAASSQLLSGGYAVDAPLSPSKLAAITERLRNCVGMVSNANQNLSAHLSRLLGATPEMAMGASAKQPQNIGVVGELDDLVSVLTEALEHSNQYSNRLSQV